MPDFLKRNLHGILVAVIVVLHLALTLHFEPLSVVLSRDPIAVIDYDTHFQQTLRALQAFQSAGRTWAYDPHLLAGQISGAIFDADTKLHELFVIALARLGMPPGRAFNMFVVLAHVSVLPTMYAAARLFRLTPVARTTALFLGSMCWFFDSFSHWVFFCGMISYGFAAYAALIPIGLFHRYREDRNPALLAGLALLLALLHHLHPYSFFILIVPMAVLYLRGFSAWKRRDHVGIALMVVFVVATNFWWLRVALRFWHYVLNSAFYLDAGASYLAFDYLGFVKEPMTTGAVATRTAFRFLVLGAAALCFLGWRRDRDARYPVLASTVGTLLGVAYFGGYLAPLRQIQPYRFILPAMFLAVIPAAVFLASVGAEVRSQLQAGAWRKPLGLLLGLTALVALPRFVRDAAYFLPDLLPRSEIPLPGPTPNINSRPELGTINWPAPIDYRHTGITPEGRGVMNYVRKRDDGSGRWLVEWWMYGERLAWSTNAQILGGFRELNMAHSDANWFRRYPTGGAPDRAELGRYLERYNVRWVLMANVLPEIEERRDLLELEADIFGVRIYRTRFAPSYIEGGGPGEVHATMDHVMVKGSRGGELVLRYHYLETLQCRPGCTVYRAEVPGDRVGFLGVRNAPPDFEVYNP